MTSITFDSEFFFSSHSIELLKMIITKIIRCSILIIFIFAGVVPLSEAQEGYKAMSMGSPVGAYHSEIVSTPVQLATDVSQVAAANYSDLFIKTDGTLWVMGVIFCDLQDDCSLDSPLQVATNVSQVAAADHHCLFVKTDGTLWVMKRGNKGQFGVPWDYGSSSPVQGSSSPVQIASNVLRVTTGGSETGSGSSIHTLFIKTDGTLWAVGFNYPGQLGDGTTTNRSTPVQVATNVSQADAGEGHSLFVKTDGTLWAMGDNSYGQLGDGTTTNRRTPVQVATNVSQVAAGSKHSLFVKTDGTLWAMGSNFWGQLGDGTTIDHNTPVQIATDVSQVAAGGEVRESHSLFIKTDGTLWAMGYNGNGQLGDSTTNNHARPIRVATHVSKVTASGFHSLFLQDENLQEPDNDDLLDESKVGSQNKFAKFDETDPHLSKIVKLAEQGDSQAQYRLGELFYYGETIHRIKEANYNGKPVQHNFTEAAKWFQKAADQGHAYAAFRLGGLYEYGRGVQKSYQEAIKRYQIAANKDHRPSQQRMEHIMQLEKERERALVKKGPFYSLPGGEFLDAIYRNDKEAIEDGSLYSWDEIPPSVSILILIANKYMYAYQDNWKSCCVPPNDHDKISKTISATIKETKYVNIYGNDMGSIPGWTSSAHYIVPKGFSFVLDKLGHNMGSDVMELAAKHFKWSSVLEVFKGIDKLQQDYECDCVEVRQFEKNLIALTTQYLKKAGY